MRSKLPVLCLLLSLSACDDGASTSPPADADLPDVIALDMAVDAAADAAIDAAPDAAPDPEAERVAAIESLYTPWVDARFFPSVSIALIGPDGVRFIGLGDGLPGVDPADVIYEIGSISKVFTGLLLAQQVDAGAVALDTPISALLPDGVDPPAATAAITLEQLTTHTSGLPRLPANMPFGDPLDPYADYDTDLLYAFLTDFDAPPNAPAEYSNLGVGLLGHLLGRSAMADSWQAALSTHVLDPLEMAETHVVAVDPARLIGGHTADGLATSAWVFTDALGAAGALRSTARDMARFAQAQLAADGPLAAPIAASQARLTPFAPGIDVGHGWLWIDAFNALFHDGGTGGFVSFIAIDLDTERAVVALHNGASPVASNALGAAALQLWRGEMVDPLPTPPAEVALTDEQLDLLTGTYTFRGTPLVVERRDDRLFVRLADQPAIGIYPLSPVRFYLRAVEAEVHFDVVFGEAARVTLRQNGAETIFERAE